MGKARGDMDQPERGRCRQRTVILWIISMNREKSKERTVSKFMLLCSGVCRIIRQHEIAQRPGRWLERVHCQPESVFAVSISELDLTDGKFH